MTAPDEMTAPWYVIAIALVVGYATTFLVFGSYLVLRTPACCDTRSVKKLECAACERLPTDLLAGDLM